MSDETMRERGALLAIGLCTYKRPEFLRKCLDSIAAARKPEGPALRLIVADNDPAGSAEIVVRAFESDSGLQVDYAVETGRGIPFARNNVLRRAMAAGATELAFLDDDEWVDVAWLERLWAHYTESGADVVRGFVETVYPPDAPAWVVKGGFYRRANYPTGTKFDSASTNNVLYDVAKIAAEWGLFFDESFGQRGGSESEYFMRARSRGAVISWAADAVVYETLEKDRYEISYLLKRKFRTRNAEAYFKGLSAKKRASVFLKSLWKVLSGAAFLPFSIIFGSHVAVRTLSRIVEGTGRLLGLFGAHIGWNEYHGK